MQTFLAQHPPAASASRPRRTTVPAAGGRRRRSALNALRPAAEPGCPALSVLYGRQHPSGRDGFEQPPVVLFVLVGVGDGKVRDGVLQVLAPAQLPRNPVS